MHSAAEIKAASQNAAWPPDRLTREQDMIDLAWHQKEFEANRSFAWVIENGSCNYSGCAYVSPSINGQKSADVTWWWRTGTGTDRQQFRQPFLHWLDGPEWPSLDYCPVKMW